MNKKYKLLFSLLLGIDIMLFGIISIQQKCINKWKKQAEKNTGQFMLMNQWTRVKQEGKGLEAYFDRNNYKKVAIYGMGYIGTRLIKELENSKIEIAYGIDKNANNIYSDIKLVTIDEKLPDVDVVVVTLVGDIDGIFDALSKKVNCPIIFIEDIVNEM